MKMFARKCVACGRLMNEGFVIGGGEEYFCSKHCLHTRYSERDFNELYNAQSGDSYWTVWEDPDDFDYYEDGRHRIEGDKFVYMPGDIFCSRHYNIFMIVQTSHRKYSLICLKTGNRYTEPIVTENQEGPTKGEFDNMAHGLFELQYIGRLPSLARYLIAKGI